MQGRDDRDVLDGMYLLADVLVGDTSGPLLVGIVFLTGLYVNLAYERLGALAKRLLPASEQDEPTQPEDDSGHSSGR
ncbi:MAG: hypothetical protein U5K37_11605 [Natrialbaceae archaeon]|nr:hypothetical protein [Natrialbaceae archaeon]